MSLASQPERDARGGPPRGARAAGRELALAALCHLESHAPEDRAAALELFWTDAPTDEDGLVVTHLLASGADGESREFAESLLDTLLERWAEVDATIERTSRRWRLERMAHVDRNVLRLAVVELEHRKEPPVSVVVAESVRIASRYGSEQSGRFVNGVVAELARDLRGENG